MLRQRLLFLPQHVLMQAAGMKWLHAGYGQACTQAQLLRDSVRLEGLAAAPLADTGPVAWASAV